MDLPDYSMPVMDVTAAYPLSYALDLQAASTCIHGPVGHNGVAFVETNHVVEWIQARVKVSIACK
jgi:hypothetical protein